MQDGLWTLKDIHLKTQFKWFGGSEFMALRSVRTVELFSHPCRVRRLWPPGGGFPERVCPDGALRPGAVGRDSPDTAEEKPVSKGRP